MAESEFRKQVKDALEHLYDTAYLASRPLLPQLAAMTKAGHLTRAQKLRSVLKEAIEALRPQSDLPPSAPEWRSYLALRYRYVQGMHMAQVESELGISMRQLQREFRKGLNAVTAMLWEMRILDGVEGNDSLLSETGGIQQLQDEMNQWHLAREACEVRALLDAAQWMLEPFFAQSELKLRVDLPSALSPVLVDSTLTRQALFQILRLVFQNVGDDKITLYARANDNRVEIFIQGQSIMIDALAPDWQTSQLLIERQGGTLAIETVTADNARVVISLPQASPPHVLVIDDNQAIHELFERYLVPHFYEVVHAHTGSEAIQFARESRPDVIILDVMMPAVDGWQVLRDLTDHPATTTIPVLVCSVLNEPELAFSLGARAYLKKPVDRLELLGTLAKLQESPDHASAGRPPAP